MGIDPPMSADEVPAVIEKVRAKLDHWKADQAAQTQKVGSSPLFTNQLVIRSILLTCII